MKVAILIGSVRPGRQSHKIAWYLEGRLQQQGICTDLIDLGNQSTEKSAVTRVQEAEALIFVTPEYHGSFSGVLKITLDEMGPECYQKPIGVVTVSSGKMGGINAAVQLQHVILSLGAYALPGKLLIPDVQTAFDDSFQLVNERTIKSANKFLSEYLWFASALLEKKARDNKAQLLTEIK